MPECVWIVGFIVVLAITIAQCPVREEEKEEPAMEKIDCVMLLAQLHPPLPSLKRKEYRPYVTSWIAGLEWDQVGALCRFFGTDISGVVTRIMDWQYNRARAGIDLAHAVGAPEGSADES